MKRLFFVCFFITSPLYAFKLSPLVSSLETKGKKSSQVFTLDNPSDHKVAVKVEVKLREQNEEGHDILKDTQDIFVFPKHLVIAPQKKEKIRVLWKGGGVDLAKEKSYRLIVKQMPAQNSAAVVKGGVNLTFLVQYMASLYVLPSVTNKKITVESVNLKSKKLIVTLKNEGNVHQVLRGLKVKLMNQEESYFLSEKELRSIENENILVGNKRKVQLDLMKSLSFVPTNAKVFFE